MGILCLYPLTWSGTGILYYGILYYGILYYGILYYGILYCGILYYGILYFGILYYGILQCRSPQCRDLLSVTMSILLLLVMTTPAANNGHNDITESYLLHHNGLEYSEIINMPMYIFCGSLSRDRSLISKKFCCVFAHCYTLDDDSECTLDYELSLLPKVFPYYGVMSAIFFYQRVIIIYTSMYGWCDYYKN